MDKYHSTVLLGIAELIGATLCVLLVRITGKRPLAFTSLVVCGVCFASTAFYASNYSRTAIKSDMDRHIASPSIDNQIAYQQTTDFTVNVTLPNQWPNNGSTNTSIDDTRYTNNERKSAPINKTAEPSDTDNVADSYAWVPLVLLLGAALFIHVGIGLVPWMLIGEMYPTNIRSGSSSISIGMGYLFAFAANKMYLWMLKMLTLPGLFWFNAGISAAGCILIYFILPETEGRTLLEIEQSFARKKSLPR